jgi:hypothetical protein
MCPATTSGLLYADFLQLSTPFAIFNFKTEVECTFRIRVLVKSIICGQTQLMCLEVINGIHFIFNSIGVLL